MLIHCEVPLAKRAISGQASTMALAIVTGGSRGLGFTTARALYEAGHRVVLVAKDPVRLAQAAKELHCELRSIDLEDLKQTQEVFTEMLQTYGAPQILVLAHGVMSEKMSKTLRTTPQEWRRVMAIN